MASKPIDADSEAPEPRSGVLGVQLLRAGIDGRAFETDRVAVEAPLEILLHHPAFGNEPASFGATMRTPGEDAALAAGLLFGEGLIEERRDIESIETGTRRPNVVNVRLRPGLAFATPLLVRRFSAGAACGVCGTTGLDASIARAAATRIPAGEAIALERLLALPQRMRAAQATFGDTGGIHAAALFDYAGALEDIAEDVGRHNAFDKLIGKALFAGRLPLAERIVLLSGRASFELVQKALRAGVPLLAAIGAPSSLAVQLAEATGLTLAGFVRERQCNVYAHPGRLREGAS
ncbi:MAG TPA: formate dehydrogenase accessory sulfurtransferase FdhD [Steroidobacteraceae bacterium]|nr:formate dehydrogenase accessory sulfurtransferase FdhD [Steroidobacteraceae bacterium]